MTYDTNDLALSWIARTSFFSNSNQCRYDHKKSPTSSIESVEEEVNAEDENDDDDDDDDGEDDKGSDNEAKGPVDGSDMGVLTGRGTLRVIETVGPTHERIDSD